MQISVQRDFASGQFVRCFALLPGKSYGVGGSGFSIETAMARCRSEYVERRFELEILGPQGLLPVGIAAHPNALVMAQKGAAFEVIESLMLERIQRSGQSDGLKFLDTNNLSITVQRIKGIGFFTTIRSYYKGKPLLSYSVRSSFFSSLLKAWEECRNPHFHKTPLEAMSKFSKSTKMFSDDEVRNIKFVNSFCSLKRISLDEFEFKEAKYRGHHIVYALDRRSR